jgi:hypothetical protein
VSNLELRSDAIENRLKIYNDANKKLQSAVFYLNRSQASVQVINPAATIQGGGRSRGGGTLKQFNFISFLIGHIFQCGIDIRRSASYNREPRQNDIK